MNQHFIAGNPPLEINLRRSKAAKRMSLRVSRLDGRVTLTFPHFLDESVAIEFAQEKRDWLEAQYDQFDAPIPIKLGTAIPFRGEMLNISAGKGRRISVSDGISVPGNSDTAPRRLLGFLKQVARAELANASDHYSEKLGKTYTRLTIRDTRTRWGSCTANGGLMYSWRLIMAPPDVLTYVAAHEVAHLAEMNHSDRFWNLVESLYGDYREPRNWLRENGHDLHRYRFED